jgi:hypothetical protein
MTFVLCYWGFWSCSPPSTAFIDQAPGPLINSGGLGALIKPANWLFLQASSNYSKGWTGGMMARAGGLGGRADAWPGLELGSAAQGIVDARLPAWANSAKVLGHYQRGARDV